MNKAIDFSFEDWSIILQALEAQENKSLRYAESSKNNGYGSCSSLEKQKKHKSLAEKCRELQSIIAEETLH
jgi:hypothetical protein